MARDIATGDEAWRAVVYYTEPDGKQRRRLFGAYAMRSTAQGVLTRETQGATAWETTVTGYIERATITWGRE